MRYLPLVLLGLLAAAPVRADTHCPPAPVQALELPRLAAARARGEVVIVTVGSSSTRGAMARNARHSYPALLQEALSRAWPDAHVAVLNRGVDGQDASEELARLGHDAIGAGADLVVWQVGANGALRDSNPAAFARTVRAGVSRLREAGADVVLMDNQRAPRILAAPHHAVLEEALAEVARQTGGALFSRGALMDAWHREGAPYAAFTAPDGLHHNDRGYACVAGALAEAIVAAVASRDGGRGNTSVMLRP